MTAPAPTYSERTYPAIIRIELDCTGNVTKCELITCSELLKDNKVMLGNYDTAYPNMSKVQAAVEALLVAAS